MLVFLCVNQLQLHPCGLVLVLKQDLYLTALISQWPWTVSARSLSRVRPLKELTHTNPPEPRESLI